MTRIADLPYDERRIIVVDLASPPAITPPTPSSGGLSGPAMFIANLALGPITATVLDHALSNRNHANPAGGRLPSGTTQVSFSDAMAQLQFPPGHPLREHAYAGHPLVPSRYIPLHSFHRYLFEEKVNELVTLLASLGATRVHVVHERGYANGAGIDMGVQDAGAIGASAERHSRRREQASFEETFRPNGPPRLHDSPIWFGHEPSWQAVADRRLKFGTATFSATLRYEEDFGVNAEARAAFAGFGVKVGGNFEEFQATLWHFEGEFA